MELILYSFAGGATVACLAWLTVTSVQVARAQAARFGQRRQKGSSALFRMLLPPARWAGFVIGGMSAKVEMRLGRDYSRSILKPMRLRTERMLVAAGHPEGLSPDEFMGLVCVGAVIGTLVGALIYVRLGLMVIIPGGVVLGAVMPLRWLRARVAARQTGIRKMLPYALDLLTLSVEAGLDFTEALTRIVGKLGDAPLAMDLAKLLHEIQLGKTRSQALRDLAHRADVSELNSVVAALIQADELGASLGPILRIQADQLRVRRSQMAEKLAMEAPVKILFPLIVFIFPTIFIMIFGPIVLKVFFKL